MLTTMYPKIELHVHLEGTRPPEHAARARATNDVDAARGHRRGAAGALPRSPTSRTSSTSGSWSPRALRTADDFRRITVDYAEEAARHGAVYIEGIFAPTVPSRNGIPLEAMFDGFCDGVQEARERLGVEIRLTPDLTAPLRPKRRRGSLRHAIDRRERGVVGRRARRVRARGPARTYSPTHSGWRARAGSARCRTPASLGPPIRLGRSRGAPRRPHPPRHPLASRTRRSCASSSIGAPCWTSARPRTSASASSLRTTSTRCRELVAAGLRCSLSTDDPAMFDIDLTSEYGEAAARGLSPREFYEVGVEGALCDEPTQGSAAGDRRRLRLGLARGRAGHRLAHVTLPRDSRHGPVPGTVPLTWPGGTCQSRTRARTPRPAPPRPARTVRRAPAGSSPTAVRPVRPCSPRALIMWKTTPVWRDWSKCSPRRTTMSKRSSGVSAGTRGLSTWSDATKYFCSAARRGEDTRLRVVERRPSGTGA